MPRSGNAGRILFLSHLNPYGVERGASLRTRGLVDTLAGAFDVDLLALDREAVLTTPADAPRSEVHPAQQARGLRFLGANLASLATGRPYTWFAYGSEPFDRALRARLESGTIDIVHVDSIDLLRYLPHLGRVPFTLTHHNVESDLLRRQSDATAGSARRTYLRLQARRIAVAEAEWSPRAVANIMVSEEDAVLLRHVAPSAKTHVIPNGIDTRFFAPLPGEPRRYDAIFTGGLDYGPNRVGIDWFFREVIPLIMERHPGFSAALVGAAGADTRATAARWPALELPGYVPDVRPWLARAGFGLVPLLSGGGTRVKILTAWSMGLPVVSTTLGCEGLGLVDGEHGLIRDSAADFADAVATLARSADRCAAMGAAGRELVRRRYSWEALHTPICDFYRGLLGRYATTS